MSIMSAIETLRQELESIDIKLEFIKIDKPLKESNEREISSINGVGIKDVIFEHEATHWLNLEGWREGKKL